MTAGEATLLECRRGGVELREYVLGQGDRRYVIVVRTWHGDRSGSAASGGMARSLELL